MGPGLGISSSDVDGLCTEAVSVTIFSVSAVRIAELGILHVSWSWIDVFKDAHSSFFSSCLKHSDYMLYITASHLIY